MPGHPIRLGLIVTNPRQRFLSVKLANYLTYGVLLGVLNLLHVRLWRHFTRSGVRHDILPLSTFITTFLRLLLLNGSPIAF